MTVKVSELDAIAAVTDNTLFHGVDVGVSGDSTKVTATQLMSYSASYSQTLTSKTLSFANNTITGTTALFNTALSDGTFGTFAAAQTDNAIARADGTGGALQTSGVLIDDSDNLSTSGTVSANGIYPDADDGAPLGSTALQWSDAFFASGAVLNFNDGQFRLEHGGAQGAFGVGSDSTTIFSVYSDDASAARCFFGVSGGNSFITAGDTGSGTRDLILRAAVSGTSTNAITLDASATLARFHWNATPVTDNTQTLGTTTYGWGDLHLGAGGVINWNNGGFTLTEASGVLTAIGATVLNQSGTSGATPPLKVIQADISEEMLELDGTTIGTGNAIEAVGAKTLTTTHFVKVTITGVGARYFPVGTIA